MVGTDSKNRKTLDPKFLCPVCSLILRDPVQFNECGHRLCQSCLQIQNQTTINCIQCQRETPVNQIRPDRGFHNDMQSLPIICSYCDWTDILQNYQKHLDQVHPNPQCIYCNEKFISIDQFNQHQLSQCQKMTVDCLLKDFGCHQPIVRCELLNHYLSKQHRDSVLNAIQQMRSQLTDTAMDTDSDRAITTTNTSLALNQLDELYETVNILANGSEALNDDTQRLNNELIDHQMKLQAVIENSSQVKAAVEEENPLLAGTMRNLEILQQELQSMKESVDAMQYVSYDGTLTWKIDRFQEKMRDSQSERQTSIYSPPFFSSPIGYKMRARLYLNGDGNARGTHMSLFFVLMRGPNDPILKFPFNYKVTFCLYDQTEQLRHIIDSFRPDIKSNSFQRPRSEMNIASGIPKFFPLAMVQQEGNPYVRDDTMFIKVMVDFGDMPRTLLPFALSLNPGIPTSMQQEIIRRESERRSQQQSS